MRRRDVLKAGVGAATSLLAIQARAFAAAGDESPRVALIGCGWYGKTDLFHLIQTAPVEVVGLCDVDSRAASQAASCSLPAARRRAKRTP